MLIWTKSIKNGLKSVLDELLIEKVPDAGSDAGSL